MQKSTYQVSSDVAFIKYWGKKDDVLRLPENGSLSMKLDGLDTVTTVEFRPELAADEVMIAGESDPAEAARASQHLDLIRQQLGVTQFAKVVSQNTFPKATGLSSSGSGFAALTLAAVGATGNELSERDLSILARQGSGTACRAVCGGFVEWLDGDSTDTSYSHTIFPASHWDLRNVVVVVGRSRKAVATTKAHESAQSSPLFEPRMQYIKTKLLDVKDALALKDFTKLGTLIEQEALEFHSLLLTSQPPYLAWHPGTVEVMLTVYQLRQQGVECYFTINTGHNVHVITLPEHEQTVQKAMQSLSLVKDTILTKVADVPAKLEEHLF
jgi:diphosphomevalonate decarboxylase